MSETVEPFEMIFFGTERYPVTRDNITLYRHLGTNAMYDHCYFKMPGGRAAYVWAHSDNFERYAQAIEKNKAPIVMNRSEPTTSDKDFYVPHLIRILDETDTKPIMWEQMKPNNQ